MASVYVTFEDSSARPAATSDGNETSAPPPASALTIPAAAVPPATSSTSPPSMAADSRPDSICTSAGRAMSAPNAPKTHGSLAAGSSAASDPRLSAAVALPVLVHALFDLGRPFLGPRGLGL